MAAPAVYLEIAIQGEDVAGGDLAGQMDQTGIGQVNLLIPVLAEQRLNGGSGRSEAERDAETVSDHIVQNGFRATRKAPQQVAGFRKDGLTGEQLSLPRIDGVPGNLMLPVA